MMALIIKGDTVSIKISDFFEKPTLDSWQQSAAKTLKIDDLEKLEQKLNKKTCEGLSFKTHYTQAQGVELKSFPDSRIFSRKVNSQAEVDSDINCGISTFFVNNMDHITKMERGEIFTQVIRSVDQKFEGDICLLDVLELYYSCGSSKEKLNNYIKDALKSEKTFLLINISKFHNAGASAVQEIASAISLALYLYSDLNLNEEELYFDCSVDSLYFANISKLRALRFIWESLCEKFNVSCSNFKIIASPSLRDKTLFDPWGNMLRTTSNSMSSFLGGADFIIAQSYDALASELAGIDSKELGLRQSRNVLHILEEESFLNEVKDPAAGSYTIESLTRELIHLSFEYLKKIQEKKNVFDFLDILEKEVKLVSKLRYENVQKRKYTIAGINNFPNTQESIESIYGREFDFSQKENAFELNRVSFEYEELRVQVTKKYKDSVIKILAFGSESKLSARIIFCKNYFEILGLNTEIKFVSNDDFSSKLFSDSKSCAYVLCSTDENYEFLDFSVLENLNHNRPCFLAGKVFEVDGFQNIYAGQNVFHVLTENFNNKSRGHHESK